MATYASTRPSFNGALQPGVALTLLPSDSSSSAALSYDGTSLISAVATGKNFLWNVNGVTKLTLDINNLTVAADLHLGLNDLWAKKITPDTNNQSITMNGRVTDAASAIAAIVQNSSTLTSGTDRWVQKWYRDAGTTEAMALTTSGALTAQDTITSVAGNIASTGGELLARATTYGHVFILQNAYGGSPAMNIQANPTDSGGNVALQVGTSTTISSADLFGVQNNATTLFRIGPKGKPTWTTGANGVSGTATLSSGTVTVSTTAVKTGSLIFLSVNTTGGTVGLHYAAPAASIVDGTSFVINSLTAAGAVLTTDTSTINWWLIN